MWKKNKAKESADKAAALDSLVERIQRDIDARGVAEVLAEIILNNRRPMTYIEYPSLSASDDQSSI